jgi:hypothetical protein
VLRALAAEPLKPLADASGAVALRLSIANAASLITFARSAGARAGIGAGTVNPLNPIVQSILGMFGDLTGWASATPSGVHGHLALPFK